jgi:hypothetical protein
MSQYTAPTNLGQAPRALAAWLLEANYTAFARERIVEHVTCHGTLAGLVEIELLDAEDEATATEVFIEALPSVPQTDRAWEDDREWTLPDEELERIDAENFDAECGRRDAPPSPSFSQWLDSQGGIAWEEGSADDPFARAEAEDAYRETHPSS